MVENRICLLDPPHIREDSEEWLTVKVEYRVDDQPVKTSLPKKEQLKRVIVNTHDLVNESFLNFSSNKRPKGVIRCWVY